MAPGRECRSARGTYFSGTSQNVCYTSLAGIAEYCNDLAGVGFFFRFWLGMRNVRTSFFFGLTVAVSGLFLGCEKTEQADHTPPPGQPPAVSAPSSTRPADATTQPSPVLVSAGSFLSVQEIQGPPSSDSSVTIPPDYEKTWPKLTFAPARVALVNSGGSGLTARFFSDDPREAIKKNWAGDRFFFSMPLQITDRAALDGYNYRMRRPYDGDDETRDGIYLKGDEIRLEPVDLDVAFDVTGSAVLVRIGGLFKRMDLDQGVTRWYIVCAKVPAMLE